MNEERLRELVAFIGERHAIYLRKAYISCVLDHQFPAIPMGYSRDQLLAAWGGPQNDWTLDRLTSDPILKQYRFCNVFRELDRVTVWIREHIREPFADHQHLWFMLAIARTINWPPTLGLMIDSTRATWPSHNGFRPDFMTTLWEAIQAAGGKLHTGAYMIRAESDPSKPWYKWSKARYLAEVVLGRLWADEEDWGDWLTSGATLQDTWDQFQHPHLVGWGPFMAYQVIVDLRHTHYLNTASDIHTWAALGPGSARGLNRLHNREPKKGLTQAQGLTEMLEVREWVNNNRPTWVPEIELSDIQNCLCEFDKYQRVKLGEGRPRALYVPGRGS